MKILTVYLRTLDDVREFIKHMNDIEGETTLFCGRYSVNAKSVAGVLSLNLREPVKLEIKNWKEEYRSLLEKYLIEGR